MGSKSSFICGKRDKSWDEQPRQYIESIKVLNNIYIEQPRQHIEPIKDLKKLCDEEPKPHNEKTKDLRKLDDGIPKQYIEKTENLKKIDDEKPKQYIEKTKNLNKICDEQPKIVNEPLKGFIYISKSESKAESTTKDDNQIKRIIEKKVSKCTNQIKAGLEIKEFRCPNGCIMNWIVNGLFYDRSPFYKFKHELDKVFSDNTQQYFWFNEGFFCTIHKGRNNIGYYCTLCEFFLCWDCAKIDIDPECSKKHLTVWRNNISSYCLKHNNFSLSGFHCLVKGHNSFICEKENVSMVTRQFGKIM